MTKKKAAVLALTSLVTLGVHAVPPKPPAPPTDAERARWTMSDMRSLATALEAFAKDHKAYPEGTTLAAVLASIEPAYIRKAPSRDAWGRAYIYASSAGGDGYTLVSAGADGVTHANTWPNAGPLENFDDDAVLDSGAFTRPWPYR